uniref:Uncharacterized protein n=1 Tax=Opuntia streptacantha TaxID=393608 RepID=A0A7C9F521_OPUST
MVGGEESAVLMLSMGENRRLFVEDQAFYELILLEDQDYILPKYRGNLPSSGFYVQVNFVKFLPHKKSTLDKESKIYLVVPYSSTNGVDDYDEILKEAMPVGEELPVKVEEKMKELIKKFMAGLKIEKDDVHVRPRLVPVFISIVATVFSSEVKDVYSDWKNRILMS